MKDGPNGEQTIMIDNLSYKVFEDNEGVLRFFVFEDEKPIFSESGFETYPDSINEALSETIASLVDDEHPIRDYWGGDKFPQTEWDWFTKKNIQPHEGFLVIEGDDSGSTINVNVTDYPSLIGLISIPLKQ